MRDSYNKIIMLPYHKSATRRKMDIRDRAAQFAPYAALVGFGDVVCETARLTVEKKLQDDGETEKINRMLNYILYHKDGIAAEFIYFEKDEAKSGGAYRKKIGVLDFFDDKKRELVFSDKTTLSIDDIVKIEPI